VDYSILQIMPAQGSWYVVYRNDDDTLSVMTQPLVGWGLVDREVPDGTVFRHVVGVEAFLRDVVSIAEDSDNHEGYLYVLDGNVPAAMKREGYRPVAGIDDATPRYEEIYGA
jgi:hypothetical protein